MTQLLSLGAINKLTGDYVYPKIANKKNKDRSDCDICGGSGTTYWSDDCYGPCLECCCIDCGKFNDECQCGEDDKDDDEDVNDDGEDDVDDKVVQNMCEYIPKNKYEFITERVSIFAPNFPDTTIMIPYDKGDITICSNIIVNCENNFSNDEKDVINKFNINNIEDLIRNDKISKNDKQRCIKCFGYVRERYKLMGIEPSNGHNVIQLEKYTISIRILPDGIIKYCNSLGEQNTKNFTIIEMV
jgi:hypothetical protein